MLAASVLTDALSSVTALVVVLVAGYVSQYRGTAVADTFVWAVVCLSVWAVLLLLPGTFVIPSGPSSFAWPLVELGRFLSGLSALVFFYIYVRLYTGHNEYSDRRKVAFLFAPLGAGTLLVTLLIFASDLFPSLVVGAITVTVFLVYTYVTGLLLLALYLLVRLSQRYRAVSTTQAVILGGGMLAPYVVIIINSLTEPTEGGGTVSILPIDISFAGFLFAGVAIAHVTRSYQLFRPLPGAEYIARDEVIENLADGILILDRDKRVIDMNDTATRITNSATESPMGRPLSAIFDNLARVPPGDVRRVDLQTPEGTRRFEVTASPIQTGEEEPAGTTVRLRDITERRTREQQLEVLTRVLRHNLRNDIDTALAYTNEIEDPHIETSLRSTLEGLHQIGEKARDVEEVLTKANEPRAVIDLHNAIQTAVDQVESEYEAAIIDVTEMEVASIRSHQQLLERLLSELLENGVEHNDNNTPRVTISVEAVETDSIVIEIADNGPGIPDHERQVIESGAETQLAHGTGLGLWLANWITESLGGELFFPADRSGGVVAVRLHAVQTE